MQHLVRQGEFAYLLRMKIKQADHFRAQIEDEIATGRLRPGERLDETLLAERFGVSRTPIRETLQQLAAIGLIDVRPKRGATVSQPNPTRLLEMFGVMAELEAMCGRHAARRLLPEDEERLSSTLESCRTAMIAGDPDAYYYENEKFHRALYSASGNRFLAEQALALSKRLAPFRRLQLRVRNRMMASQHEHDEIVSAIMEGDAIAAADRLRAHVAIQGERFGDLVASIEKASAAP